MTVTLHFVGGETAVVEVPGREKPGRDKPGKEQKEFEKFCREVARDGWFSGGTWQMVAKAVLTTAPTPTPPVP